MPTVIPDLVSLFPSPTHWLISPLANADVSQCQKKHQFFHKNFPHSPNQNKQTKNHFHISVVKLFHCIIIMYLCVFHSTKTLPFLGRNVLIC